MIGVISDTHGLLRPEVFETFSEVDWILHAGDVGEEEILKDLASLAPVEAVYGNTDRFPLLEKLPEKRILELEGFRIFLTHIGGDPDEMKNRFPEIRESDAVIFGHSHHPSRHREGKTLFFNPGSAGPRRFRLPVTVGLLTLAEGTMKAKIVPIGSA